jgi:hypothetical protein
MTTYYKATTKNLTSAHVMGKYSIQYKLNEVVKPQIGKCMIFEKLENAVDWMLGDCIFECEATDVEIPVKDIYFYSSENVIDKYINYFWSHGTYPENLEIENGNELIPEGTLFASEVKLTRQIR